MCWLSRPFAEPAGGCYFDLGLVAVRENEATKCFRKFSRMNGDQLIRSRKLLSALTD
jgi:hypothetical protein